MTTMAALKYITRTRQTLLQLQSRAEASEKTKRNLPDQPPRSTGQVSQSTLPFPWPLLSLGLALPLTQFQRIVFVAISPDQPLT